MTNQQATKAQKQWFWEQCGFRKEIHVESGRSWMRWIYPDGQVSTALPSIDLNNLFKYAVPKVKEKLKDEYLGFIDLMQIWLGDILSGKDPALALFWAIYKAFGGKQCAGLK